MHIPQKDVFHRHTSNHQITAHIVYQTTTYVYFFTGKSRRTIKYLTIFTYGHVSRPPMALFTCA